MESLRFFKEMIHIVPIGCLAIKYISSIPVYAFGNDRGWVPMGKYSLTEWKHERKWNSNIYNIFWEQIYAGNDQVV